MKNILAVLIVVLLFMSACSSVKSQQITATQEPTATNVPTATFTATYTATATSTNTPVPTMTPTATQTQTPTSTPTATLVPTRTNTPKPWPTATPKGPPGITISKWPKGGVVSGKATGINPSDYKVAVFIKVDDGWWTKPFFDYPLTRISANGYWECAVVTGGHDQDLTEIVAYLVPNKTSVPQANGGGLPSMEGFPMARATK